MPRLPSNLSSSGNVFGVLDLPYPVVLASASPRRRELLSKLIKDFEVVVSDVDEDALTVVNPVATSEKLARANTRAVATLRPDALVIGADTVVYFNNEQFAKPTSTEDAVRMLERLSGRRHKVCTAVCVKCQDAEMTMAFQTKVWFKELTLGEISDYVATGEPMDKAGGYAIQGGAAAFVTRMEGSMDNVIGLPVDAVEKLIRVVISKLFKGSPSARIEI